MPQQHAHSSRRLRMMLGLSVVIGSASWTSWHVRGEESISPKTPLQEVIQLGETLVQQTKDHPLSRPFVGNALSCTSCHLDNGRHPEAGTFLGTATAYPAWSPREMRVITLEDRILNCFMRSCNGTRPPLGSKVSVAIAAYITSLSQGEAIQMNGERPIGPRGVPPLTLNANRANVEHGQEIYNARCADCHGSDGQGDSDNPPVWGDSSYNDGAGLAQVDKLAAWLKVSMPLDDATMTEQESLDVAAYVDSHARPKFSLEDHLPHDAKLGEYNGNRSKNQR